MRFIFLPFFLVVAIASQAQKLKKEDKQLMANLKGHVVFLSSDQLEGRRTGTTGEKLAADYISTAFKNIGITPKGTSEYFQQFEVNEGKEVDAKTHLLIDGHNLVLHKDFFPLSFSPNASVEAVPSIVLQEADMPWFVDLKELLEENKSNPHFDINEAVSNGVKEMHKNGATAIFLYNTSEIKDGLQFNGKDKTPLAPIPIVYITKPAAAKFLSDETASPDIKLKTEIVPKTRTGTNVVAYIDNSAPTTIVLGAHYDHLGWGEDGNSMIRTGSKQIHNGADDNASGTAALIELARALKISKYKSHNYLFIAFSGEELGLFGSKYFVENPTVDLNNISFMINMDMLGRLNDSSKVITVGGYGTSPLWGDVYNTKGRNALYSGDLKYKFDSSGTGPSDHTSFYKKDIPVLFYFTGLHADYHKPTDDFDKINYNGQLQIVKHIYSLVEKANAETGKIAFTKTREVSTTTSARFSVTMGIMPDYTYSGAGVRVDGVSENRPAQKAGIRTGDIITAIGNYSVTSVESYMQALSKFKKGEKTTAVYKRGNETLSATIEF